ncbi:TetR/AcrR family transcriptional regulator [Nocardioides seonyuensis]|uniref:TetR/AcrR family transcriptional regulator n=1 Tax=Nocardioides seonyuensis TaxID=2518371 RepID=A0A4P7IGN0_9ACTN|nr:TetR/AcrR family transcriptional regulator [Nocardioides seonyuensis]QBX56415.1 TetR/AcrR family transcriptional regulator [Nocardioides seonyuensis]
MTFAAELDPADAARSARAERRSAQLLEAAARLMERDGSHAVSMQSVAAEAGVSVGLIYRYFGSKDDLLLAVIIGVLDSFATRVPAAVEAAGDDPVHRLAAGFRAYCEVIDERRHAAVLTYRETKSLDEAGRARIKELEVQTSEPLRAALRAGVEAGVFDVPDLELAAYDLLLLAHAWALKHWYFERTLSLDTYAQRQLALVLKGILEPKHRRRYADLLTN